MITYDQYREKCRQIVREAHASDADNDGDEHAARLLRSGRWDERLHFTRGADAIADATWPAIEALQEMVKWNADRGGPEDEGDGLVPPGLSPDHLETLAGYGRKLFAATTPDGLRNQSDQFWMPEEGPPEAIKLPCKSIYRAHSFRVEGKWQEGAVTAEIDRVIRKAASNG